MWDDPKFNPSQLFVGDNLEDPDFAPQRREAILAALETLYIMIAKQRTWKEHWHEDIAREAWTWRQLLPHVPPKLAERIMIERQVNTLDPDFSFHQALAQDIPGWK